MSLNRLTGLPSGRRMKFVVVLFWLLLATVAAPLAGKLTEVQNNDTLTALPHSAEAAAAAERAEAAFPGTDRLVAVAVYARDSGLTDADKAKAEDDRAAFTRYAEGREVAPAFASTDGKALLVSFQLAGSEDEQSEAVTKIRDRLAADAPDGLKTALTGSAGGLDDVLDAFEGLDSTLLLVTAGVVALLLLLSYRSPVLWIVPLLTVGVASQVAVATVYLLARYAGLAVDLQAQSILTILVFGVGTDYALLLIARYREELRRHRNRHEAMAVALRRSFPAILASAATVAIGLLCLFAAALVTMATLLPALLVVCGRWLFWPFVPRYSEAAVGHDIAADHGIWARVARTVGPRPRAIWIGSGLALVVLILGVGNLSVGLPGSDTFTKEVGSVTGQRLIERHYPGGASSPADILAATGSAERVAAAASDVDGVAEMRPAQPSADGRWVRIPAVLDDAPDSQAGKDT